ncbi:MAG: VWA domain-containing protein [Polyangiaceae bacterium]
MRWGDVVVAARDIPPGKPVYIGEGAPDAPVDFTVPQDKLGAPRAALLLPPDPGARAPRLAVPDGARLQRERDEKLEDLTPDAPLPLLAGDTFTLHVDDISFEIRLQTALEDPIGRVRWGQVRRFGSGTAASLFVHVGILLAAVAFGAQSRDPDQLEAERAYEIQQYLLRADEKALEELEAEQSAAESADNREGGTGTGTATRARGEEGSMGAPGSDPNADAARRYGIRGPQDQPDPHIQRQADLQDAAEFGMIGLLNSGAGGDPNSPTAPWGRDDSLGADPFSARGNAWATPITPGGVGQGGGGRGEGIGLGSIGTIGHGAGTGTGQGFGSGAGRLAGNSASARRKLPGPPAVIYGTPPGASTAPAAAPRYEEPTESPIDPNGRFATTYRPGGGHLAAFESAVARGVLPQAEREVVSDVGARYVPAVPLPDGQSLGLRADLERTSLPPTGGAVHLRLSLASAEAADLPRPDLAVTLVLDVSGSMNGDAITNARAAAHKLVDRLAPTDRFSLVTFSNDAQVLVPIGQVGPRRGFIHATIHNIGVDGGTNIGDGLRLGYEQTRNPSVPADAVRCVMLLSDGHANAGETRSSSLARMALDAFQDGIQTSSFGLGDSYDGPLMSSATVSTAPAATTTSATRADRPRPRPRASPSA